LLNHSLPHSRIWSFFYLFIHLNYSYFVLILLFDYLTHQNNPLSFPHSRITTVKYARSSSSRTMITETNQPSKPSPKKIVTRRDWSTKRTRMAEDVSTAILNGLAVFNRNLTEPTVCTPLLLRRICIWLFLLCMKLMASSSNSLLSFGTFDECCFCFLWPCWRKVCQRRVDSSMWYSYSLRYLFMFGTEKRSRGHRQYWNIFHSNVHTRPIHSTISDGVYFVKNKK